ncbi:hypothetical protein U1Q18_014950 [Sarracenia purpurea var. burkii]
MAASKTISQILLFISVLLPFLNLALGCLDTEREALLQFKAVLIDDNGRLSSWGSEELKNDCCNWTDVRCDNLTGHVTELHLRPRYSFDGRFFYLGGKISPSLLQLQNLKYLDLSQNRFTGIPIPEFIGSLSSLQYLDLSSSYFSGSIPHQLMNLSNLRYLDLGGNNYLNVENLEWVSHLSLLSYLDLSTVNLSKAIDWAQFVNNLPLLEELRLFDCNLPDINPPSPHFNSSKSLYFVNLFSNLLSSSIFSWLSNFSSSLVHIDLSFNQLQGPLPNFTRFSSLQTLDLGFNQLNGTFPEAFGQLPTLTSLLLSGNQIKGSLPDLTVFPSLTDLRVERNQLKWIDKSIGTLSKLQFLDASYNSLEGIISEAHFSNLSSLSFLDFSYNSLLSFNFSSDWVPPFKLHSISLASCKLGPHFPKWLRNQNLLSGIDISSAGISENVPSWFSDISMRLAYLNLSHNQISGLLPDLSLNISCEIKYCGIDLSSNNFSGPIPPVPPNVTFLNLSKNKLLGSVSFLCAINGETFSYLDLSNNLLSGELPDCWAQFKVLSVISLSTNRLSGKIPTSLADLSFLGKLDLSNNNLSGKIPSGTQLQSFEVAAYSGNPELCGLPLPEKCPGEETTPEPSFSGHGEDEMIQDDEDGWINLEFYLSMDLGLILGFWGVFGTMILNNKCRFAYFKCLGHINDWICLMTALIMAKLQKKLCS